MRVAYTELANDAYLGYANIEQIEMEIKPFSMLSVFGRERVHVRVFAFMFYEIFFVYVLFAPFFCVLHIYRNVCVSLYK